MADGRTAPGPGTGQGTAEDPWTLKTPPRTSEYQMYKDPDGDPPALVCVVGTTTLRYHLRAVEDLRAMLVERGDWVELGAADEQKPAKDGTVEAWGRDEANPVGGWYGLRKGYRGRFGIHSRRCWSTSAWPTSSTIRATIGSARGSHTRSRLRGALSAPGSSAHR